MPWIVAHQAPLSMGFPRQEYWSGLPFPLPGDLPHAGIKPMSPALSGEFFAFPISFFTSLVNRTRGPRWVQTSPCIRALLLPDSTAHTDSSTFQDIPQLGGLEPGMSGQEGVPACSPQPQSHFPKISKHLPRINSFSNRCLFKNVHPY